MKFHMLASGSKGNAFILEKNDTKLLIDCGTTKRYFLNSLNLLEISIEDFDGILITHNHSDHIKQINIFKDHPFVFSPEQLNIDHHFVYAYEPFMIDDFEIFPLPTSHDAEVSVGYVISDREHKLVYMTDTGYVKEEHLQYMYGADYIVMESNHDPELLMKTKRPYYIKQRILSDSGHLSNDDAGEVLGKIVTSATKEIILAHLSEEANREDIALDTVSKYLNGYKGKLKVGKQYEILSSD